MRYQHIARQQRKLLVYFSGWGTPISIAKSLELSNDFDLLICYDYRDLNLEFDFSGYQEIYVVAWSLGVWVAERVLHAIPLTYAVAINGTGAPKHDQFGIPTAVFDGTLSSLSEENLVKFERRMCGKIALENYRLLPEKRDFTEVKQELARLNDCIMQDNRTGLLVWQKAIIGNKDKIIPTQNQLEYWQNQPQTKIQLIDAEHYLFNHFSGWQELLKDTACS